MQMVFFTQTYWKLLINWMIIVIDHDWFIVIIDCLDSVSKFCTFLSEETYDTYLLKTG